MTYFDDARISRRDWVRHAAAVGLGTALSPRALKALQRQLPEPLIERTIPGTDETLPVIGLGGANSFANTALEESRAGEYRRIRETLAALVEGGGSVFDTAYGYGASEQVAGQISEELGVADRIWWSTKFNAARVAGGVEEDADLDTARYQIQRSFLRLRRRQIDLFQVHNMGDPLRQLTLLKELKELGYVRYIGVTSTFEPQYEALAEVMRSEPIDFVGVDYAIDHRVAEDVILPLAQDRGIGVLAYMPFGRTRLWNRIGDHPLPDWAHDFDAHTWAHFMLKFVIAHPAVTVVCPGTSDPAHMVDNLSAGRGRLPDEEQVERMTRWVDALPSR